MTREEAIEILRDTPIDIRSTREDDIHTLYATAQNMAIEAIETVQKHEKTFEWCTGCKEYDQENHCCHRWSKTIRQTRLDMEQEFGIVRCEDCKHWVEVASACTKNSLGTYSWEYCSDGERREP